MLAGELAKHVDSQSPLLSDLLILFLGLEICIVIGALSNSGGHGSWTTL